MGGGKLRNVLHHVGRLVGPRQAQDLPDQELLSRFVQFREEAAFAALMERHGAMVLGVCGRVLKNAHDAEDACQAVFLVLARKAHSVRKRGSLASWLHGVAWRVARKLRSTLARRNARESVIAAEKPTASAPADISWREVLQTVDEELQRLPEVYRAPLVLCHLQGRTQDEAVRELGWTIGVLRGRLQRGREKLRARLLRRGLTASAALGAATLAPSLCSAAVPSSLVVSTLNASLAVASSKTFPTTLSAQVVALSQQALRAELLIPIKMAVAVGFAAALVSAAVLSFALWRNPQAQDPAASRSVEAWPGANRLEGHPGAHAWCVNFSPDGKFLASGAGRGPPIEGELKVWDASTGQVLVSIKTPEGVRCVAFAPDGKTLATAEHDDIARLRDIKTGKVLVTLEGHRSGIDTVAFSRDGKTLASSSWDGTVKLWDTATGQLVRTLAGHTGQVFAVAFGAAEGTLASAGADGTARIWDAASGQLLHTLKGHHGVVHWLAYAPDGKTIATASWDKTVKLWETATGRLLATLGGHRQAVLAVVFSHDGKTLASCSGKWEGGATPPSVPSPGEVIVWDLRTLEPRARLRNFRDRVFGVAFSPDDKVLASAAWDGSVRLWKRELVAANEQPPQEQPAPSPDLDLSLKGKPEDRDNLELIGPAAQACVRFEPDGLRITLPAGFHGERPDTGVRFATPVQGNFEATVNFEILYEPEPEDAGVRTKLMMRARLDRGPWTVAALTRRVVQDKGTQFTAWMFRDNHEDSGTNLQHSHEAPTQAKKGALRLVRSGSAAFFYVADGPGADFTLLNQGPFGAEDSRSIDLCASTGGPKAALDIRFTDLHVRTGIAPVALAESDPHSATLVVLVLAVVLSGAALGIWLGQRRLRRTQQGQNSAAASATFPCPICGKRLNVRAELAGKSVKCPGCGQAIQTPGMEPSPSAQEAA